MSLQSHHQTQRAMDILQSNTKGGREIELRKCPSDLLFHSFLPTRSPNTTQKQEQDGEEELNLGLSLGGRFGVDKSHKGLVRSSSLAGAIPPARTPATLARTASLPPETEEEWRKRKELQSLRRLEAKRKRSDKQQSLVNPGRPGKPSPGSGYPVHWARTGDMQLQGLFVQQGKQVGSKGESLNLDPGRPGKANPCSGYPVHWGSDSQGVVKSGDLQLQGLFVQQEKQVGSQGSSGVSQEESLNLDPGSGYPKSGSCGDLQDPFFQKQKQDGSQGSTSKSSSNASENEKETIQGSCCGARTAEVSSSKNLSSSGGGENGMGNMPCVFTVGDGPRGRKVEGILYRYKKGEEVRIMCVCHGSFFTPAEFVNHSGAHNVAHPLKRIVVNPNV